MPRYLSKREMDAIPDPAADPADVVCPPAVVVSAHTLALRRAMRGLAPIERRVIDLSFGLSGLRLTMSEIAAELGCSERQAFRWSADAKRKLLDLLSADPAFADRRVAAAVARDDSEAPAAA